jgi:hypothetical protein
MRSRIHMALCAFLAAPVLTAAIASAPTAGDTIPLPGADKKVLEQYLGRGVVGDAVEAKVIGDPAKLYGLAAGTRTYKLTSGKEKGSTEAHVLVELKRDKPGSSWTEKWGTDSALGLHRDDDGSIHLVTHNEHADGVITHYAPTEPMVIKGMKPGESRKSTSKLKVYDLSHPDHLTHKGQLDLTLTYVGAYRVTVPAGSYDAVLLKWQYTGKVGPAKVNDLQYRLLADGVGTVAEVEKKKVSAMLVYSSQSKSGKVLVSTKAKSGG